MAKTKKLKFPDRIYVSMSLDGSLEEPCLELDEFYEGIVGCSAAIYDLVSAGHIEARRSFVEDS